MTIITLLLLAAGYATVLLLDWLMVLMLLRVICRRCPITILLELADSGRPLVDRTAAAVRRWCDRLLPNHDLSDGGLWLAVVSAIALARLVIVALLSWLGSGGGESRIS